MKTGYLYKEDGVALITALMMTLISLTIIMAVLSIVTKNIQSVGGTKRFKSALEASYGGSELVLKQVLPALLSNTMTTDFTILTAAYPNNSDCNIANKLNSTQDSWNTACSLSDNPKVMPDITFQLPASTGAPYMVYAKIVDTLMVGNTDRSEGSGGGAGGAGEVTGGVVNVGIGGGGGGGGGGVAVKHVPFVYRVEVQAERSINAVEKANLSVLYAY